MRSLSGHSVLIDPGRRRVCQRLGITGLSLPASPALAGLACMVTGGNAQAVAGVATGIAPGAPSVMPSLQQGRRTAFIVGNADYPRSPLRNPVNDARLVARTLKELGFEVALLENGGQRAMVDGLRRWLAGSESADVRVFYFAGHGAQFEGNNYLLPVDLSITRESHVRRSALLLADVVDALSAQQHGVNFVIIDACRTDPSALLNRPLGRTRGLNAGYPTGLGPQLAPRGTVVAYSTAPGSLAADRSSSANSLFTATLAAHLKRPGLPVESLFKQVRLAVMQATSNAQVPWERSSLVGDFCFLPDAQGRCGYTR